MFMLIDWHAHHTPPELADRFQALGASAPRPDPYDSTDFSRRVAEMDAVRIDLQIVSQGAGANPDRFPAPQAIEMARLSNDVIAERIAPHPDRLSGSIAFVWNDVAGSVAEIQRMADQGFRAVMMYARPDKLGDPEVEPLFAKIADLGLPIFLHGGGGGSPVRYPGLDRLEDGGQGVAVSAHADGAVADFVVRMIAAGLFDRYPGLQVVIRSSGGGVPLLLGKLYWKHQGPDGERRYADILLEHFLVDCASARPRTLAFLIDTMGEERVVFGSDYCGGLGPLEKAMPVLEQQPDSAGTKALMERNSRRLLGI
jgi:predicted TIM-barrel fold metal-dependent hydrolase